MSQKYLDVHRVGYVSLQAVEAEKGKTNAESLKEHLEQAAQDGQDHCSFEELCNVIDESRESIKPEIIDFLDGFTELCRAVNATGDIIFY